MRKIIDENKCIHNQWPYDPPKWDSLLERYPYGGSTCWILTVIFYIFLWPLRLWTPDANKFKRTVQERMISLGVIGQWGCNDSQTLHSFAYVLVAPPPTPDSKILFLETANTWSQHMKESSRCWLEKFIITCCFHNPGRSYAWYLWIKAKVIMTTYVLCELQ